MLTDDALLIISIGQFQIQELKFIVPNQATKSRVVELWTATFNNRQAFRLENRFTEYLMDFPVFSAYNGELVSFFFKCNISNIMFI